MMFTQIALLDSVPDELLKPAISGKDYTWFDNAGASNRAQPEGSDWTVTWMPGGFEMKDHERQSMATSRRPVDHMVFTDGLAMVSVFVEQLVDEPPGKNGPSRMGGVNAFARFSNGYQVTAVGEVPQATVQRMANSVVADK
jgi:sigma-E factor negative regulatory protein RseB